MSKPVEANGDVVVNGSSDLKTVADNSQISADKPAGASEIAPAHQAPIVSDSDVARVDATELAPTDSHSAKSPTKTADPSSAEAQIAFASEIETASAQPPVVSAPESDLRESPTPVKQEEAATLQEEKRELDARNDSELAQTTQASEQTQTEGAINSMDGASDEVDQINTETPKDDLALRPATMLQLDLNALPSRDESPSKSPKDTEMAEAPPVSSTKTVHERDESPDDEPAAKRSKTESPFQNGNALSPQTDGPTDNDEPITPYQTKEIAKQIRNTKSTIEGRNFKGPVVDLWPSIKELYLSKIDNPIDLTLIENRVKKEHYKSISYYIGDVKRLYDNCVTFNGPDHDVTTSAIKVRDSLLSKIPPTEAPKAADKRKKTAAVPKERPASQPRAPYTGTGHGQSPHPQPAAAQTYALDPSGTPIIRRDSTKGDGGRPKRDIHPPKPRDINYNSRPKKKKYAVELKYCQIVLDELYRPKYTSISHAFLAPVDPVALGIPDYFKFVRHPMDMQTIRENLTNGHYENAKDFEADIRLMFRNCYKFNPSGTPVHLMGKELEAVFDDWWAKKDKYIQEHTQSAPVSPESSGESAGDESEEEVDDKQTALTQTTTLMQARLVEEQRKLIEIMQSTNNNEVLVRMQSEMVAIIQKEVDGLKAQATTSAKKGPSKTKGVSKKAAPAKRNVRVASKPYKIKHIGQEEKEQISAGITQLEGKAMEQAIAYLKEDIPTLNLDEDPELDIDQFSNGTLSKLHDLIQRHCPQVIPAPAPRAPRAPKPVKPKKNKPMSKREQEEKIQKLRQLTQEFQHGRASSGEERPMPCKYTFPAYPVEGNIERPKSADSWQAGVEHWLTHSGPAVEHDQMSSSGDESPSDSEED